jgi:hypothetical protein
MTDTEGRLENTEDIPLKCQGKPGENREMGLKNYERSLNNSDGYLKDTEKYGTCKV